MKALSAFTLSSTPSTPKISRSASLAFNAKKTGSYSASVLNRKDRVNVWNSSSVCTSEEFSTICLNTSSPTSTFFQFQGLWPLNWRTSCALTCVSAHATIKMAKIKYFFITTINWSYEILYTSKIKSQAYPFIRFLSNNLALTHLVSETITQQGSYMFFYPVFAKFYLSLTNFFY